MNESWRLPSLKIGATAAEERGWQMAKGTESEVLEQDLRRIVAERASRNRERSSGGGASDSKADTVRKALRAERRLSKEKLERSASL